MNVAKGKDEQQMLKFEKGELRDFICTIALVVGIGFMIIGICDDIRAYRIAGISICIFLILRFLRRIRKHENDS